MWRGRAGAGRGSRTRPQEEPPQEERPRGRAASWPAPLPHSPPPQKVVLCAQGPTFTGGLDLAYLGDTFGRHQQPGACPARARERFLRDIKAMQEAYSALERQRWPVIAAVQGACVGAGVDLVTACDLRYATRDAYFCVKEVDVGITADLGTLQRLPSIVGHGVAAEMALTGRRVGGEEAAAIGLVSKCFPSHDAMIEGVMQVRRRRCWARAASDVRVHARMRAWPAHLLAAPRPLTALPWRRRSPWTSPPSRRWRCGAPSASCCARATAAASRGAWTTWRCTTRRSC
jgi:enoyl-CoA hydratase/carnithine racemase